MAARPNIPYFAPAELLPAPLPTVAEILASTTRLSKEYENLVYRVGEHFAVKFGPGVHIQEGENMYFVQHSTQIPVPKVYALFHDERTNMDFIVQEYISGTDLDLVWGTLDTNQKQNIASQLHRQPIRDFHFLDWDRDGQHYLDSLISGPHETEDQWIEAMWQCVIKASVIRRDPEDQYMLPLVRHYYQIIFKGHEPVFTHGNILPRNIMLQEDGTVVLIDWERAGWYPSYWEFCCTVNIVKYIDDWGSWICKILDEEYVGQLGWMQNHRNAIR
ncbi:kinase-like domain-containing protein [Dichotomopilus funicola]|uniref:Kinase-like domain-containing protein n=1 Tax=Dichotomopilus funicola TaxID=1934379 RepID=A0AAN6V006_9PEZI|nr:kinase-like domain-containing protein [Dichotomopilus funicola]